MIKVAFLNPNAPPRSISLINHINKNQNIDIKAFFFSVSQKNRSWNLNSKEYEKISFQHIFLKSFSFGFGFKDYHNSFFSINLAKELQIYNPDLIVIPGWADINSYIALLWGKLHNKKVILRTESTINENSYRRKIFLPLAKFVCFFSDGIIASSDKALIYSKLLSKNNNAVRIHSSFDTKKYLNIIKEINTEEIKSDLKIKQEKVYYFNGQLIERKGIKLLLEIFAKKEFRKIALIITGKGILTNLVDEYAMKFNNIYSFGYQNQQNLPRFYSVANFFILPSYEETWGLVTVEAMASGTPVLISNFAGSSELISKKTGFIIKKINKSYIEKQIYNSLLLSKNRYKFLSLNNKLKAINDLSYEKISNEFCYFFERIV
jgi:glycosyltransferase involved in cell wall biosynthesis